MTDKEMKYYPTVSIILIVIGVALSCIGYSIEKSNQAFGIGLMFLGVAVFLFIGISILGRVIDEKRIRRFEKPNNRRR